MDTIRKAEGFQNEFLFVVPEERIRQAAGDELFRFLQVTDIGYFPRALHHYRERPAGCETAILLYCRDGRGCVSLGGKPARELAAGQAVLIPPNTPHWYGASQDEPWSVYWAHLRGELVAPALELVGGSSPLPVAAAYDGDILREFYRCFELLKAPCQREEYFLVCQSAASLLALLAAAARQARQQLTEKGEQGVERCVRFMKANLSRSLSLEQLAQSSGFSASHLNLLFKQSTGHAPMDYFLRMKIQAASRDLFFTTRPVKEIALDYGIRDPYYFSRLFKKIMGVSPAIYRNQVTG